jgi:hypothetical protein
MAIKRERWALRPRSMDTEAGGIVADRSAIKRWIAERPTTFQLTAPTGLETPST